MHKKLIVSLCAVTLLSLGGAALGPVATAIHADVDAPITNKVDEPSTDKKVTVSTAVAEPFEGTVELVDKDGKHIGDSSKLVGKIGDHVMITLPTGYVSAETGATTIDYVLNKEKKPIKIEKYSERCVFRTIKIHRPDGVTVSISQEAKANGEFAEYKVPEFKYYKPSATKIPAAKGEEDAGKTLEVSYVKTLPSWAIGVDGYTVIEAGTISRTVNFVDESGKQVAPSVVQTVKREILVKDSGVSAIYGSEFTKDKDKMKATLPQPEKSVDKATLSTAVVKDGNVVKEVTTATPEKENAAVKGYLVLEIDGSNASVVSPAYKLDDIVAPKIKGMKVKNPAFEKLNNQFLWLSAPSLLINNPTLPTGMKQMLTSDTIVNVIYTPDKKAEVSTAVDTKDRTKNEIAKKDDSKQAKTKDQKVENGKEQATTDKNPNAQRDANAKSIGVGVGAGSGVVLPQTGNHPTNWLILAIGSAFAALGLFFADKFRKQKN